MVIGIKLIETQDSLEKNPNMYNSRELEKKYKLKCGT
jgi:hypothetical protein